MNPFEMVVAIFAIVAISQVLRAKYGVVRTGRGKNAREEFIGRDDPEKERLRAELQTLKERVAVLERLATDDTTSLEREIERLRDKA